MDTYRLVVDLGSSSKKYALFHDAEELSRVNVDHVHLPGEGESTIVPSLRDIVGRIRSESSISVEEPINEVVIRIVAPGKRFAYHQRIDESFLQDLAEVRWSAPLHIDAVFKEIHQIKDLLPSVELIAASDSAFHATLPERARRYAIPQALATEHDFYRTGYHGLSVASIVHQLQDREDSVPSKLVVCHLGAGVSVTALLDGKSVDTSMGLTPLEGVPMSTRVGDIDPGVLLALLDHGADFRGHLGGEWPVSSEVKEKITDVKILEGILSHESGLKALSGRTGDMKELLELRDNGDEAAAFAIEVFCYKIRKYIGAYAAALGGLDALILTGTIAERSEAVVREITEPLAWLGAKLEVIPTNELAEMARIPL